MARSQKLPADVRLASSVSLWRLNAEGLLRVSDRAGEPITAAQAKDPIGRILREQYPGLDRFPRPGETYTLSP